MLSVGNGEPWRCVSNMLLTLRGEVPYERLKGIDGYLVGSPLTTTEELAGDIEWLIETYEPRIESSETEYSAGLDGAVALVEKIKLGGAL